MVFDCIWQIKDTLKNSQFLFSLQSTIYKIVRHLKVFVTFNFNCFSFIPGGDKESRVNGKLKILRASPYTVYDSVICHIESRNYNLTSDREYQKPMMVYLLRTCIFVVNCC